MTEYNQLQNKYIADAFEKRYHNYEEEEELPSLIDENDDGIDELLAEIQKIRDNDDEIVELLSEINDKNDNNNDIDQNFKNKAEEHVERVSEHIERVSEHVERVSTFLKGLDIFRDVKEEEYPLERFITVRISKPIDGEEENEISFRLTKPVEVELDR